MLRKVKRDSWIQSICFNLDIAPKAFGVGFDYAIGIPLGEIRAIRSIRNFLLPKIREQDLKFKVLIQKKAARQYNVLMEG